MMSARQTSTAVDIFSEKRFENHASRIAPIVFVNTGVWVSFINRLRIVTLLCNRVVKAVNDKN